MSKRQLTFFAAFVIALIGICLIAGQIANAKERNRDNKLDQRLARGAGGGATVNGTVTDGSGHGWPLYSRVEIDDVPVFTDPITGQYTANNLNPGQTYTFEVTAESGGYVLESREVTPPAGTSTEDFALLVEQAACNAPGYAISGGTLFDFDSGIPAGWTVINNQPSQNVEWRFDDPCFRGNNTGGENGFAIIDSDCDDQSQGVEDSELRTTSFDFSGQTNVLISFDTDFNWFDFSLDEKADVDVSTDGGGTWTNVLRYQGEDVEGPHHEAIDISSIAGGQSDVTIRFHYYDADFEFWWEVDNVVIGSQCSEVGGGLVVGNVFDLNSSTGVNGATVTSDAEPADTATTFATPDDPNQDDGFYVLFSSLTGPNDFTASKSGYGPDTHSVAVVTDGAVEQDFSMGAGVIETDQSSLEATVQLGSTDSVTLTLNNTGTADADFQIKEGEGLPEGIRRGQGAPIIRIPGRFSPLRAKLDPLLQKLAKRGQALPAEKQQGDKKEKVAKAKKKKSPLDPPWTAVADYPVNIMDNAAVAIDGLVYSIGGFDGGSNLNSGYVYDPAADTWTPIASMTGIREKPVGVAIDGLFYVVGGWSDTGDPDETLEIYNPATDTWSTGAPIPTAYAASAGVNLDGLFYTIGGCDIGSCGFTDVQVYDPSSDTWSSAADYPEDTSWLACGAIDGLIYCAGGVSDSSGDSASTYVYDPAADSWTQLADMPQTQWGSGFIASGGKLYAAGGIVGGAVSNESVVYDPASDSWSSIEPTNNVTYRAGSACGLYRMGGALGFFDPIPDVELYPGLSDCDTTDVPWVSEDPSEGTVPEGGSVPVTVTFDTTVLNQPGDYFAHLQIKENTPTSVPDVGVTLHVPLPAGWGYLEGTVNALGRCDVPAGPLSGATVLVDTAGVDWTLKTDDNGFYKVAFPATDSPVVVTVSAEDYVGQFVSGVTITPDNTTTQDFEVRLDAPCADKSPTSFDVTLSEGGSSTQTLTLTNDGAGALNFNVFETVFPLPPEITRNHKGGKKKDTSNAVPVGPSSVRSQQVRNGAADPTATASWFFGSPIPGGAVRYAHAQCDTQPGSFYVISGVDGNFDISDRTSRYDAATNSWTELAPIPEGQEGPSAACYQGQIYVVGGGGTSQFFIYDIASDRWSTGAALPRNVWGSAVAAWDGKVYMIGGDDDFNFGGTSDEVDIYDIETDTWTGTGTAMPAPSASAGYVQQGPYLYIAGGWNDDSPAANNPASQRYDTATDTWTSGPNLNAPRGDLGLAGTENALYAIGGDGDGGGPFDSSGDVERLDLATWPSGAWTDLGDPIPAPVTANNGGFCTEELHVFGTVGEFWTGGGLNEFFSITGNNAFRPNDEHCYSIFSDVPWLEVTLPSGIEPVTGSVPPDSTLDLNVNINTSGLTPGDYTASIVITTNDPAAPQFTIPVTLHVTASLLNDDFNDGVLATDWTYKQNWSETGGSLTVTSNTKKASAIATPIFPGCDNCGISTSFSATADSLVSIYGWWVNNKNYIEVQFKEGTDKVQVKEKVNGNVVNKQSASVTIDPGTFYNVTITYSGTSIVVNVDGTDVLTYTPTGALPVGTAGFVVKGTGSFDYIIVN